MKLLLAEDERGLKAEERIPFRQVVTRRLSRLRASYTGRLPAWAAARREAAVSAGAAARAHPAVMRPAAEDKSENLKTAWFISRFYLRV